MSSVPTPATTAPARPEPAKLDVIGLYPALAQVAPQWLALGDAAQPVSVATGTVLFDAGAPCGGFPLVLEGEGWVGLSRERIVIRDSVALRALASELAR